MSAFSFKERVVSSTGSSTEILLSGSAQDIVRSAAQATLMVENLTRQRILASRIHSAADSAQRRRGLLDVMELDADAGLWINPCEAVHTFGMQVSLDALFLDAGLRVRKISAHLKPNRIAFCFSATSVLEMQAGLAAASGTECGDQLVLRPAPESTAGLPSCR